MPVVQSPAFYNFSRLLIKIPEHTWWGGQSGLDALALSAADDSGSLCVQTGLPCSQRWPGGVSMREGEELGPMLTSILLLPPPACWLSCTVPPAQASLAARPHLAADRGISFLTYFQDSTNYTNAYLHAQLDTVDQRSNYQKVLRSWHHQYAWIAAALEVRTRAGCSRRQVPVRLAAFGSQPGDPHCTS